MSETSCWFSIGTYSIRKEKSIKSSNVILVLVLVLFSGLVFAEVILGSLHFSDAQRVDNSMEVFGIYNGRVKIIDFESLTIYVVEFPGNYFSWKSDSDIAEISAFFVAVARVSLKTLWHSDVAIALYEDDTIGMFTVDCRTVLQQLNRGYDVTAFISNNVLTGNRATSELRL